MATPPTIRDRIVELRRVPASSLTANPKNWRRHPASQKAALEGVLAEIGYADALLARETPEGLILIDGHLRAETTPDAIVPVLILDVDEEEADKILLTHDPLAAMASKDKETLEALLDGLSFESDAVNAMLDGLRDLPPINPMDEWQGMPEFTQEDQTAWKSVIINFGDAEALNAFARLIGQPLTEKTRSVWYPQAEIGRYADKRYISDAISE